MRPGKLFWKIFLGNVLLMAIVLGSCVFLIVSEVAKFHERELSDSLRLQAATLCQTRIVSQDFGAAHRSELDQFAKNLARAEGSTIRITFIDADGTVLGDSEADPATMESHADRPEVREALRSGWGEDSRLSHTVNREMKYVAARVGPAESPLGVVRVSMALGTIGEKTYAARMLIWRIALLGLAAAVVLALGLARLWSTPIRRITNTAQSLSRGDLSTRAQVVGGDELSVLAGSLNQMRDHLASQLETIDRQRLTLEALLAQLHEAVIVTGPDGRILLINPEAIRLLGLTQGKADRSYSFKGLSVERVVRQPELRDLLSGEIAAEDDSRGGRERAGSSPVREVRLEMDGPGGRMTLLARASDIVFPGWSGEGLASGERGMARGRLLVLTDVTELARMIQVKTDFAANASHELRTPLSAIRAAVETLSGLDLAAESESARHFLQMIDRHSNRMEALVVDLLDLSRIESSPTRFKPEPLATARLIDEVQSKFAEMFATKGLDWQVEIADNCRTIIASPYLLRVTLDNLVENAIKFTERGGQVRVSCSRRADEAGTAVAIAVRDTGCGIPEHEQDRVFERFYQVERSRTGGVMRGTGLGLSIVRHAVAAMDGTVRLQSKVDVGTTVTLEIPQNARPPVSSETLSSVAH